MGSGMRKKGNGGGKRGRSISNVKKTNIRRNKLVKAGKMKPLGSKPRFVEGGQLRENKKSALITMTKLSAEEEQERLREAKEKEEEMYADMVNMMDPEDLEFLKKQAKSHPNKEIFNRVGKRNKDRVAGDDRDVDEEYEREAMLKRRKMDELEERTLDLLPVRTKQGWIRRSVVVADDEEEGGGNEAGAGGSSDEEEVTNNEVEQKEFTVIELIAKRKDKVAEKKLQIGSMANNFLESPDERISVLEKLVKMVSLDEEQALARNTVFKLAALSVCEILKDVIPNYRILDTAKGDVKLKKETLRLHKFEQGILNCTKNYLVMLEKAVQSPSLGSKEVSLGCMCEVLLAHPHFNFAENVVNFVVPFLNSGTETLRAAVSVRLQSLLRNDKRGDISLAVVRKINHVLKSKKRDRVKPTMLQVLLSLKLHSLNEARQENDEKKKRAGKNEVRVSKKERKRQKANEKLEKELLEAKGEESKRTRHKFATEITNLLFAIYFRLLKTLTTRDEAEKMSTNNFRSILRPLFVGLSKFGHLMSIGYFQDLLGSVSHFLAGSKKMGKVEVLLCVQTVFTILSGQGNQLMIDPVSFYDHINEIALNLSVNDEMAADDGCRRPDEVLLNVLKIAFIQRRKKISINLLIDIWKRLAISMLANSPSGVACLITFLKESASGNPSVWNNYLNVDDDVETGAFSVSCAAAGRDLAFVSKNQDYNELESRHVNQCILNGMSLLWELSSLIHHYDPIVCQSLSSLLKVNSLPSKTRPLEEPSNLKDFEGNVVLLDMDESESAENSCDLAILSTNLQKVPQAKSMKFQNLKRRRRV